MLWLQTALLILPCIRAADIQVDLIFPQNNSVIQPAWPFPLVFAVHNFSSVPWIPYFRWQLLRATPDRLPNSLDDLTMGEPVEYGEIEKEIESDFGLRDDVYIDSDQYLAITAARSMSHQAINRSDTAHADGTWMLEFALSAGDYVCPPETRYTQRTRIFFNTSLSTGAAYNPDIYAKYGQPIFATTADGQNQTAKQCPLSSKFKTPIDRVYEVDQKKLATDVSSMMANFTGCRNVTWPQDTGLGKDRCSFRSGAGASRTERINMTLAAAALITAVLSIVR